VLHLLLMMLPVGLVLVLLSCARASAGKPGPDVLCQRYAFGFSTRCVLTFGRAFEGAGRRL